MLAAGLIAGSAALMCFVTYDDSRVIGRVFNSDYLLPTSLAWNLWHGPDVWRFQLPRIPSIFPGLVVYATLDAILRDFRATIFGYSVFQCIAFAGAGGVVISQITGARLVNAAALLLVLTEAVIVVDLPYAPVLAQFEILTAVGHFGAFLVSLVAVALVISLLESWSRPVAALLTVACCLAFLSNRMCRSAGSALVRPRDPIARDRDRLASRDRRRGRRRRRSPDLAAAQSPDRPSVVACHEFHCRNAELFAGGRLVSDRFARRTLSGFRLLSVHEIIVVCGSRR
jgi:hypothetical protein